MPTQSQFRYTIVQGTTSGTIGTQTTHAHGLGIIPDFYIIKQKGAGVVYEGTVSDATNIYIKGTVASLPFEAQCFIGIN